MEVRKASYKTLKEAADELTWATGKPVSERTLEKAVARKLLTRAGNGRWYGAHILDACPSIVKKFADAPGVEADEPASDASDGSPLGAKDLDRLRAKKLDEEGKILEYRRRVLEGELIDVGQVKTRQAAAARVVRDEFQAMPARLAPLLEHKTAAEAEAIVAAEVRRVLDRLPAELERAIPTPAESARVLVDAVEAAKAYHEEQPKPKPPAAPKRGGRGRK